jgi:hypothetical protein
MALQQSHSPTRLSSSTVLRSTTQTYADTGGCWEWECGSRIATAFTMATPQLECRQTDVYIHTSMTSSGQGSLPMRIQGTPLHPPSTFWAVGSIPFCAGGSSCDLSPNTTSNVLELRRESASDVEQQGVTCKGRTGVHEEDL